MILEELADAARARVALRKKEISPEQMRAAARALPAGAGFPFEAALRRPGLSFICEVKRASPSKGVIAEAFPYVEIAREYAAARADALSVLTEPERFLGHDDYLREIAADTPLPVLRKDFTVDDYQIYEAKTLGAGAVLLICALLPPETLAEYIALAHTLGLSALVETRTAAEVGSALGAGARIIGVNNRDLRTFEVDLEVSETLGELIPPDKVFVSESGIFTLEDVKRLRRADAVLIGEAMMRAADKRSFLAGLRV
ncbi:MAG: indole-3-glycerol phosphate synthase TrpC [Oscillospiraceae bacterium]|nr:indole-3-glycerol phosphate synthase TrpC [Oscillospiraceae bacterium]